VILEGNQRGYARDLATHLMKDVSHPDGNDHVEVLHIRGVDGDTVMDALLAMEALATGTQCRKHLYSVSLNPPPECENPQKWIFEQGAELIEQREGLQNQPRVLVMHEKEGRIHAHAVWSRIYFSEEKQKLMAIEMPYDRRKLNEVSIELYKQHGWKMPEGFKDRERAKETNYTRAEWSQFKRSGVDPNKDKADIRDAYQSAGDVNAMQEELKRRGFVLCHGERGYLALNTQTLEPTAISKATGLKIKDIRGKLGDERKVDSGSGGSGIQTLEAAKAEAARMQTREIKAVFDQTKAAQRREMEPLNRSRAEMVQRQQQQREALRQEQERIAKEQATARATTYRQKLAAVVDIFTGQKARLERERQAQRSALLEKQEKAMADLRGKHLEERRALKAQMDHIRERQQTQLQELRHAAAYYIYARDGKAVEKPREAPPPKVETKVPEPSKPVNFVMPERQVVKPLDNVRPLTPKPPDRPSQQKPLPVLKPAFASHSEPVAQPLPKQDKPPSPQREAFATVAENRPPEAKPAQKTVKELLAEAAKYPANDDAPPVQQGYRPLDALKPTSQVKPIFDDQANPKLYRPIVPEPMQQAPPRPRPEPEKSDYDRDMER
jgi:hypothetical protein